jgi:malate/lactate dehydrogenase
MKDFDVCLSMPVVLGSNGVEQILVPQLNEQEQQKLKISAATIKKYIQLQ